MNELEQQLAKLVQKGIEAAEKTGQFVIDQAPDLLQEFYRWHLIENIFFIFAWWLIVFAFWKLVGIVGMDEEGDSAWDWIEFRGKWYADIVLISLLAVWGLIAIISLIVTIVCIYDLVFLLSAPKLYLIEYFIK